MCQGRWHCCEELPGELHECLYYSLVLHVCLIISADTDVTNYMTSYMNVYTTS